MNELFDTPFDTPEVIKQNTDKKCKHCIHSQRWECGSKYFWYCSEIKSNRTENKLGKIKANDSACLMYKDEYE